MAMLMPHAIVFMFRKLKQVHQIPLKVRLKREFLDQQVLSQRTGSKILTGEEWYSQQASRAVNQAVGRVIRHRHDYGAIIFCDERFTNSNRQSQISRWIQPHIKCYSKFGDVVFTLTRFFRDAAICGPTKRELTWIEDQGDICSQDNIKPLDKLHLDKLLSPLTATVDKTCSVESLSSLAEVKRGNISGQLGEILPANLSNLPFNKHNQSLTSKYMQFSKHKVIVLTRDALLNEETDEELIAPCSSRPRIGNPQRCNLTPHFEISCEDLVKKEPLGNLSSVTDSMRHTRPQVFECGSMQNAQDGSVVLLKDEMTTRRTTDYISQKSKGVMSSSATCGDEEKKGSTFLIQVREKLTDAEYKEFVGFMKALKSKAMKIGHVLQSITKLFSAPDRLPLLQRFKDYIPAK